MTAPDSTPARRRRRGWALAGLGAAALAAVGLATGATGIGESGGTLRASFSNAVNVVAGQEVRIAGRRVGRVGSIELVDREAVVELRLSSDAWPIPRGTTARIRNDSISGYAGRYVDLEPGPPDAEPLPAGGILAADSTVSPVEFDEIFDIFDESTRGELGELVDRLAATLADRGEALSDGLERGSHGLEGLDELLAELGADGDALRTLAVAGARTASALRAREAELVGLIDAAAETTDELAERAAEQRLALDALPGALGDGERLLARLDTTVNGLDDLVSDLGPGARGLSELAPVLTRTVRRLERVAPIATRTLAAGTESAPAIERLMRRGTRFMPRLRTALRQLDPVLECLRPYTPELAGWFSTWLGAAGRGRSLAGKPYGRILFTSMPPGLEPGSAMEPESALDTYPGLRYAMPRPPGLNAGQPWFQPRCGAGPEALDPSVAPSRGPRP